jgi:uncharacterized protein (TIGR03435 family)
LAAQQFEVASLKPASPGEQGESIRPAQGGKRYTGVNRTLRQFLLTAYGIRPDQISGGPAWIDTPGFDLNAEAESPSNIEELHMMLRNLITERFKLQLHTEKKERAVYALVPGKNGVKMQPDPANNAGDRRIVQGMGKVSAKFASMEYFAFALSLILDRPVIDRTGLTGEYDFELSWTPDPLSEPGRISGRTSSGSDAPPIFEALEQQLGLKLVSQRAVVETLVIDHAERPVEN